MTNDSCDVPPGAIHDIIGACYADYDESVEDTSIFGPVSPDQEGSAHCLDSNKFNGIPFCTAWQYTDDAQMNATGTSWGNVSVAMRP